jgi:hypothetical protein
MYTHLAKVAATRQVTGKTRKAFYPKFPNNPQVLGGTLFQREFDLGGQHQRCIAQGCGAKLVQGDKGECPLGPLGHVDVPSAELGLRLDASNESQPVVTV